MAKAIFSAIYLDKVWAETIISQPTFYLCQQVPYCTLSWCLHTMQKSKDMQCEFQVLFENRKNSKFFTERGSQEKSAGILAGFQAFLTQRAASIGRKDGDYDFSNKP